MTAAWQPCREPLRVALLRNGAIAAVAGAGIALASGGLARWPVNAALVLWVALGGHLAEVWFLNWLRPRIAAARRVQVAARIAVWLVAGVVLGLGMMLTARAFGAGVMVPGRAWWLGGVGLVLVELVAHLALRLRGRPSFYDGRG